MQSPNSKGSKIPYGNNPDVGQYVNVGDAKIYYEIYGKGAPFVILHGGNVGSTYEMGQFIDSLSTEYQVIAISTRGHGKSEVGTEPVTYEQRANDVFKVVDAVTKESVIVLGFSDGAYSAYKLASLYPSKVKKIIAIGAGEQTPGLREVNIDNKAIENLDIEYWKQRIELSPDSSKMDVYAKSLEHFYNTMVADKALFNSIKCPVLVMSGERDQNALLASVIATYQMIPNSQLAIIPNAPHPVFIKNFEAVWASIKLFLKE